MNDYFLSVQLHYFGFNFADIISYEFFDVPKGLKQAVMTMKRVTCFFCCKPRVYCGACPEHSVAAGLPARSGEPGWWSLLWWWSQVSSLEACIP